MSKDKITLTIFLTLLVVTGFLMLGTADRPPVPPQLYFIPEGSIPSGPYVTVPGRLSRGNFVLVDLPREKWLRFRLQPKKLAKILAAGPGDLVVFSDSGISVNGRLLPFTAPLSESTVPEKASGKRLLSDSECVVVSIHPRGFDSRYFGVVNCKYLTRMIPLSVRARRIAERYAQLKFGHDTGHRTLSRK